jgi:alpha-galactosidase
VRNDGFARFVAKVGVNDSAANLKTPVTFEVYGDGKLLARSRPMLFGQAAAPLAAGVKGVRIIELVARSDTRSGAAPQAIAWADAALLRD